MRHLITVEKIYLALHKRRLHLGSVGPTTTFVQQKKENQATPLIPRERSKLFRPNFLGAGRKHTLAGVARDATLPILRYTGNNAGEAWEITSGQELMVQRSHFDIGACVYTKFTKS